MPVSTTTDVVSRYSAANACVNYVFADEFVNVGSELVHDVNTFVERMMINKKTSMLWLCSFALSFFCHVHVNCASGLQPSTHGHPVSCPCVIVTPHMIFTSAEK